MLVILTLCMDILCVQWRCVLSLALQVHLLAGKNRSNPFSLVYSLCIIESTLRPRGHETSLTKSDVSGKKTPLFNSGKVFYLVLFLKKKTFAFSSSASVFLKTSQL